MKEVEKRKTLKISEKSFKQLKKVQQHFSSLGDDVVNRQWTVEKCIDLAFQMFVNKNK